MEAYEKSVRVLSVPSGLGARDRRCGEGPRTLLDGGLLGRLAARGARVSPGASVQPVPGPLFRAVADLCDRLAREIQAVFAAGEFPLVLGGDHSCAIGTWAGAAKAMALRGPIGLVWIDAHMDAHTLATSHTGMPHGMPVAALLGHGEGPFVQPGALEARHVCLVGVHSFEPEEPVFAREVGMRSISMQEVRAGGVEAALREAVAIATNGTSGFGISLDLDAVDPGEAPGVGTPVPGGIAATELVEALRGVSRDERLIAFELVEYNPRLDRDGRTARLAEDLLAAILVPRIK